jgi:UPF0716 protein FxsA
MWLFALFLSVPLIEIALFITVGGWITLWPTLGLVVLTAVIGSALVRHQGLKQLQRLADAMNTMRDPVSPMAHGLLIVLAGILLITPGFFTDALGFLLLVPLVRSAILARIAARVIVAAPRATAQGDEIVEGEFEEVPPARTGLPPSGWTRH